MKNYFKDQKSCNFSFGSIWWSCSMNTEIEMWKDTKFQKLCCIAHVCVMILEMKCPVDRSDVWFIALRIQPETNKIPLETSRMCSPKSPSIQWNSFCLTFMSTCSFWIYILFLLFDVWNRIFFYHKLIISRFSVSIEFT